MSAAYSPKKIGVVGLGYVGLPVAAAFASKRPTVGFDINEVRVNQLREGLDVTGEVSQEELLGSHLEVSADSSVLEEILETIGHPLVLLVEADIQELGHFCKNGNL